MKNNQKEEFSNFCSLIEQNSLFKDKEKEAK